VVPPAIALTVCGLIPALLQRHLTGLGCAVSVVRRSEGRRGWFWDEAADPDEVEALVQVGMTALAIDRDTFLRSFGRFFLTALVPSPGGQALHPDPLTPRFDVLFGPPTAGREAPGAQDWSFPGPLLRLEDIQSELQVCFPRMVGPTWAPPVSSEDGRMVRLACRPGRAGWGSMAVGMVEALAPRCGAELVAAVLRRETGGSEWVELTVARLAAGDLP
jgi:hypothetical protein